MRVHLVQSDIVWEDKPANHDRVRAMLKGVEIGGGDLIVLPEMFDTGFSLNVEATHDGGGESAGFIRDLARSHDAWAMGGITIAGDRGAKARNRALCFDPRGELAGSYDKLHPFSYGREGERFEGGKSVGVVGWGTGGDLDESLALCQTICYDLRFPELYRAGLSKGAEAFAVIANWPDTRAFHWRALAIARAIENQAYVFAVNRVGTDPVLGYAGGSIVVSPTGEVVAEAGADATVLSADVEPGVVRSWRGTFPAWRDRRDDL
ncbi:MAG: nitrilase-related carbon-nitrogen hydrolase [Planctomycetota bacterium]